MRHPKRRFPGVLIQGDTLHSMRVLAEKVLSIIDETTDEDAYYDMEYILEWLTTAVEHYNITLSEHGMDAPFVARK